MFRTLIYPSPGACDYAAELPYWSLCSWFVVLEVRCGWVGVVSVLQPATRIPFQPNHTESPTQRTKNITTNMVIKQHGRKLLMMDILMSETCWAHKKWNKITSDIKLIFYSSTITMMHGPVSISNICSCEIWDFHATSQTTGVVVVILEFQAIEFLLHQKPVLGPLRTSLIPRFMN